ncbi:MAG: hypothetical protein WD081_01935 [Gammaproteobacteria bacterium]
MKQFLAAVIRWMGFTPSPTGMRTTINFTPQAFANLCGHLSASCRLGHEGIVYLLGTIDGAEVIIGEVYAPAAETTAGSFYVPETSMAQLMRRAADVNLMVVGQVHTHPGDAYHSNGDMLGMDIRHDGYVSIVVPSYGARLPTLDGIDVIQFSDLAGWRSVEPILVGVR